MVQHVTEQSGIEFFIANRKRLAIKLPIRNLGFSGTRDVDSGYGGSEKSTQVVRDVAVATAHVEHT